MLFFEASTVFWNSTGFCPLEPLFGGQVAQQLESARWCCIQGTRCALEIVNGYHDNSFPKYVCFQVCAHEHFKRVHPLKAWARVFTIGAASKSGTTHLKALGAQLLTSAGL